MIFYMPEPELKIPSFFLAKTSIIHTTLYRYMVKRFCQYRRSVFKFFPSCFFHEVSATRRRSI